MRSLSNVALRLAVLVSLAGCTTALRAQDTGMVHHDVTVREWDAGLFAHTGGIGAGFRQGRTPDLYNRHFWEVGFLYDRHPKSVRSVNALFNDARPCRYGQLYTLFFLRCGYGYGRVFSLKPYWGGVQISCMVSGGFSLGMGVPSYVEIYSYATGFTETVRYDPDKHDLGLVVGGAPFLYGWLKTTFRPGFYAKAGLNFDFADDDYRVQAIEIGVCMDMIFPYLQQMAFNKAKPFYPAAYIAYDFGKRQGFQKHRKRKCRTRSEN